MGCRALLLRRRMEPVTQHDVLHFCRIRRATRHERRDLAKIAGSKHAGRQDAETTRRLLRIVAEGVNDPALDEDGLTGFEGDVLTIDAPGRTRRLTRKWFHPSCRDSGRSACGRWVQPSSRRRRGCRRCRPSSEGTEARVRRAESSLASCNLPCAVLRCGRPSRSRLSLPRRARPGTPPPSASRRAIPPIP